MPRGRPFPKGVCPNPRGRPKLPPDVVDVREYAKQYTKQAIDALAEIAFGGKASVTARMLALNALLDRGYGRPTQGVDLNAKVEAVHQKRIILEDRRPGLPTVVSSNGSER
jgi:hypothetical protein